MKLDVHGHVAEPAREAIEVATARHRSLEDIVQWALAQRPPLMIDDVIEQDEYTQDVILPYAGGLYLVYDTT